MTIRTIIDARNVDIVTCRPDMTVTEAVALLSAQSIGAMPVIDDTGGVAGIFSERDVIRCLEVHGAAAMDHRVSSAMTAPAITVSPDTTEDEALSLMTQRRFRHLPVMDGDTMVDFVSIGDLVKAKTDAIEAEAKAMRSYIHNA